MFTILSPSIILPFNEKLLPPNCNDSSTTIRVTPFFLEISSISVFIPLNKFLVDEDLSPILATKLNQLGYKANSVRDIKLKGADDINIVEWSIKNSAVIITGDKDYGELWYWHYHGELGIIVLKLKSYRIEYQYKVIRFLHENNVLKNEKIDRSLIISSLNKYRIRTKE